MVTPRRCGSGAKPQRGFTYVGLLLAVALLGIGLTAASEVWVSTASRERNIALEWAGAQFVSAIGSYYESTPGLAKAYPGTLDDLLEDRRYVTVRRHLRMIYLNPLTSAADWIPVKGTDGRLRGVRVAVPSDFGAIDKTFVYVPASGSTN